MHLEEKAAEIVDLFARLGGCWSTLSTPPRYGPALGSIPSQSAPDTEDDDATPTVVGKGNHSAARDAYVFVNNVM